MHILSSPMTHIAYCYKFCFVFNLRMFLVCLYVHLCTRAKEIKLSDSFPFQLVHNHLLLIYLVCRLMTMSKIITHDTFSVLLQALVPKQTPMNPVKNGRGQINYRIPAVIMHLQIISLLTNMC